MVNQTTFDPIIKIFTDVLSESLHSKVNEKLLQTLANMLGLYYAGQEKLKKIYSTEAYSNICLKRLSIYLAGKQLLVYNFGEALTLFAIAITETENTYSKIGSETKKNIEAQQLNENQDGISAINKAGAANEYGSGVEYSNSKFQPSSNTINTIANITVNILKSNNALVSINKSQLYTKVTNFLSGTKHHELAPKLNYLINHSTKLTSRDIDLESSFNEVNQKINGNSNVNKLIWSSLTVGVSTVLLSNLFGPAAVLFGFPAAYISLKAGAKVTDGIETLLDDNKGKIAKVHNYDEAALKEFEIILKSRIKEKETTQETKKLNNLDQHIIQKIEAEGISDILRTLNESKLDKAPVNTKADNIHKKKPQSRER